MNYASISIRCLKQIGFGLKFLQNPKNSSAFNSRYTLISLFSSESYRNRINRKRLAAKKPTVDKFKFRRAISQLLPRFKPEDLYNVISRQNDPLVCLELFNWASKQHRFKHDVCTYHITINKLGGAKMFEEMDQIVNEVLLIPWVQSFGSEVLYNSMIYFFTQFKKLSKAIEVYKHMKSIKKSDCRPTIRTYNLLFVAFLRGKSDTYINHIYMDNMSMLFKQMIDDGVAPDVFALNYMIKGYVLSLHLNDALRIYHQMDVVYNCPPNSYTFNYIIHGLCAQGRTRNAMKICGEMKEKGFILSSKSYNSLVCAFALAGEVDQAVSCLWEMVENQRLADYITYRTLLDECSKLHGCGDALSLLNEFQEKRLVDIQTYDKLRYEVQASYKEFHYLKRMKNGLSYRIM